MNIWIYEYMDNPFDNHPNLTVPPSHGEFATWSASVSRKGHQTMPWTMKLPNVPMPCPKNTPPTQPGFKRRGSTTFQLQAITLYTLFISLREAEWKEIPMRCGRRHTPRIVHMSCPLNEHGLVQRPMLYVCQKLWVVTGHRLSWKLNADSADSYSSGVYKHQSLKLNCLGGLMWLFASLSDGRRLRGNTHEKSTRTAQDKNRRGWGDWYLPYRISQYQMYITVLCTERPTLTSSRNISHPTFQNIVKWKIMITIMITILHGTLPFINWTWSASTWSTRTEADHPRPGQV